MAWDILVSRQIFMRKLGIWDGLFQEMGQPRPSIRPVVDQQPVWWDHLLHPEDVLPVALDAALLRCCLTGVDPKRIAVYS